MEDAGVDISWLHHSQRLTDEPPSPVHKHVRNGASQTLIAHVKDNSQSKKESKGQIGGTAQTPADSQERSNEPAQSRTNGTAATPTKTNDANARSQAIPPAGRPSPTRKSSWISNLSSKFSSSSTTSSLTAAVNNTTVSGIPSAQADSTTSTSTSSPIPIRESKKTETTTTSSQSPKAGSGSFIHSALRRLSASAGTSSMGKASNTHAICPRRVLNVDPYRERCDLTDLQPTKLRRVAFCVDVEIAAPTRYIDDDEVSAPPPLTPGRRPSLTQLEQQIEAKKTREKKLKEKGEGEALKNPQALVEEKEKDGVVKATGEFIGKEDGTGSKELAPVGSTEAKDVSRKKEKKKRSEEERKERKERKKQQAVDNGTVPVEVRRYSSSQDGGSSMDGVPATKTQDRPTTDPLRIYRRCCQLRETSVQKKIAEQLASPTAYDVTSPGTIGSFDLTDFVMSMADIITFGDFLAVVPVKRLILENCGLSDESLRIILAALLAVKTVEQTKHNRRIAKIPKTEAKEMSEHLGVIEKLSLKGNRNITRDGWRHISLFIYMSQSLKAIDLSMVPFPKPIGNPNTSHANHGIQFHHHHSQHSNSTHSTTSSSDSVANHFCSSFHKALGSRRAGSRLEELAMGECGLTTEDVKLVIEGVMQCGTTRLGLASNSINSDGFQFVMDYLKAGKCEGLDLGGNDLSDGLQWLADSLDTEHPLFALSLADCNLTADALKPLFSSLIKLPNFKFIDLSHNRDLFTKEPSALGILRKYLPHFPILKRLHLADVDLSSEDTIALAEVLPEIPHLAHLSILKNPQLKKLASAKTEEEQEEACALYASLMAAVRVSNSIVSIEIDVPSQESSEIVKALAKQVVAYSLRNVERGAEYASAAALNGEATSEPFITVPDVLYHLIGQVEGGSENHDEDEPAPDDDYIVGGTGVVKALGICLGNKAMDRRKKSRDVTPLESGAVTPTSPFPPKSPMPPVRALDMSKNLLGSARKIRHRLQPALAREAKLGNEMALKRLQFLDSTLEGVIQRFEDEYPECRTNLSIPDGITPGHSLSTSISSAFTNPFDRNDVNPMAEGENGSDDDGEVPSLRIARHGSDVSLASRNLANEEGRMHRFGQQMRRDLLRPQGPDHLHGTTGTEIEAQHIQYMRDRLDELNGEEIKKEVETYGPDAILRKIGVTIDELRALEQQDPESWEKLKNSQLIASFNMEQSLKLKNLEGKEDRSIQSPSP
ncbi:hypothetical protein MMC25_005047 [Agyrium rufum]|nr:hypothetical protein [Agyrium rufum]